MEAMELLRRWQETPPQNLPLHTVRTDPRYQPRCVSSVCYAGRQTWENSSAAHVNGLRDRLRLLALDPILVADIDGVMFVVDGHHRLRAYRAEGCSHVPARVLSVSDAQALQVSALANASAPLSLSMVADHRREALWRFLGSLLQYGRRPDALLPSQRKLAQAFGVPQASAQRMCGKARERTPTAVQPHGLPWPLWREIATERFRAMGDELDRQQGAGAAAAHRRNRSLERVAQRHRESIDAVGIPETLRMLDAVLREHRSEEAKEGRRRIAELARLEAVADADEDADSDF
jgi:hypothetical protein